MRHRATTPAQSTGAGKVLLVLLGFCALAWACQPSPPYPPVPFPPENPGATGSETAAPTQLVVALRVVLGRRRTSSPEPPVELVAVVYDMDGTQTTTPLGAYHGTVFARPPEGDELIRVIIRNEENERALRLIRRNGFLEARRTNPGKARDREELIRRIPVPKGAPVRAGEPPVENVP